MTLHVGNREDVLDRVRSHSVDVAFSGKPPSEISLIAEPLIENEIVCITAPDDPAVAAGAVQAIELTDRLRLLREPGSGTRVLNEQFLRERGMHPDTLTLGSNGAIK